MRAILLTGSLAALAVLAGCATTQGQCSASDRDASFLTKLSCDTSGGYRAEVVQNEQRLLTAREENLLFQQVYEDIQARQVATRATLSQQKKEQATLDASLGRLLAQLKARHASNAQAQKELDALEAQRINAQSKPTNGASAQSITAKRNELKAIQAKVSRLQQSLGYQ